LDNDEKIKQIKLKIEQILDEHDKIELLSKTSLIISNTKSMKVDLRRDVPGLQFLIGLSLKKPNTGSLKVSESTALDIIRLLEEYFMLFGKSDKTTADNSVLKDGQFSKEYALDFVKSHNLLWQINMERYEFQHIDFLLGIFGQLNDLFISKYGFTVHNLLDLGYFLHESHFSQLSKNIISSVPVTKNSNDKQDDGNVSFTLDVDNASDYYVFDIDEVSDFLSLNAQTSESILDCLSCKFGQQNNMYETPIDKNLFYERPLIRISKKSFFVPQTNSLVFYLNQVLLKLLEDEKELQTKNWEKYNRLKKKYLEEKTVQYLSRLFPRHTIVSNAKYEYRGIEYETDVLVAHDNKLLIFETKSGMISDAAKRGGEKSVETSLKNIMSDAMNQAQRVRNYVLESTTPKFANKLGQVLEINEEMKKTIQFQLVNVTLEPLSAISANLKKISSLGLFDDEFPWSVNIFDLDVITDILEYPSTFIHYIEKRLATQKQGVLFTMDETTIFSMYIMIGTLMHSDQEMNMILFVPNWADDIENYYLMGGEKPRFTKEKIIMQLIEFLEQFKDLNYTRVTSHLLNIHGDSEKFIVKQIPVMLNTALTKNRISDFSIMEGETPIGITFMASKNKQELEEKLLSYCIAKKYQAKSNEWIGISIDPTKEEYYFEQVIYLNDKWEYDPEIEDLTKTLPRIDMNSQI